MKRRNLLIITGQGIGALALHGCGGGKNSSSNDSYSNLSSINELRSISPKEDKQQFYILGHTIENIGGGLFYYDANDTTSPDDGGSVIVNTDGNRFKRIRPTQPTAEMFGALANPNQDQSVFINNCTLAYGECYLQAGATYNIYHQVNAIVLKTYGNGLATLNCVSPTNDGRFGSLYAAVFASGSDDHPLTGVDIQNVIIHCNGLIGNENTIGIKGFLFFRLKNFYQRNCTVINSASYGFWDTDTAETGTIYCSGTRDDCWAVDCSVSFEQVNVKGVTLNNCHGYISDSALNYTIECIFHPYGGESMEVVYNNCSGISDGHCPTIFLALLTCKNITANDCIFINNHNANGSTRTALYFESSGGNFNNFMFRNCIIKALFSPAAYLDVGENGSENAIFKFTDCIIDGYQLGVQINGLGGYYSFVNCHTQGSCDINATPFAYYANGAAARNNSFIKVIGGSASTVGPNARSTTNFSNNIYQDTLLSPEPLTPP